MSSNDFGLIEVILSNLILFCFRQDYVSPKFLAPEFEASQVTLVTG